MLGLAARMADGDCTERGILPGARAGRSPHSKGRVGPLADEDTLQVRFESIEALRREFEKNIANRGLFVATDGVFAVRDPVTVEIVLEYVDASNPALALEGEIVHCVPAELAASGATPGVAVQLDATAAALRERFAALLGQQPFAAVDADREGERRRASKRGPVRIPVRVMPTMSQPFETTSRDLSGTGILLTMKQDALPLGEIVRVCLWHPSGEPSIEIDGKVVRQIQNKKGRVAAAAIAFDRRQAAEPRTREVVEALREAGHRSQLGGISGSLSDLGLANMLQMFGSSAPQGTLVVEHEGEQGWVAFADGDLLGAELGLLSGQDALVAMLAWGDGHFQFEASVDAGMIESARRRPLPGAVLAAVCALDEANRDENDRWQDAPRDDPQGDPQDDPQETQRAFADGRATARRDPGALQASPGLSATFEVDREKAAGASGSLDKTEEAVLELLKAGMSIERIYAVIPEPEGQIQSAFEGLLELGVVVPR